MIKNDLFNLVKVFEEIKSVSSNPKFAYAIAKNKKLIKTEVDLIRGAIKPNGDMDEYDKARVALCRDFAKLDENQNPVVSNNNFVIDEEKQKDFDSKIDELRTKYKTVLDEHRERLLEADQLLKEDVSLDFHLMDIDVFPDGLTQEQYEHLMVFVNME